MPLSTRLGLSIKTILTGQPTELVSAAAPVNIREIFEWSDGSGANQSSNVFADTRTLAAEASEDIHLTGVLTNGLGQAINLTHVRGLYVKAHATNVNDVLVGDWETNVKLLDHVPVRPGGIFLLVAPDVVAYDITTNDSLHIANGGAGTPVTYDIVVVGS